MSTIALEPTWTGPAWATEHTETDGGLRWTRSPATSVTTDDDGPRAPGEPVKVEAAVCDFLTIIGPSVQIERQDVQVFVDDTLLDLDGARNLIAALTELVEAVEEGTR